MHIPTLALLFITTTLLSTVTALTDIETLLQNFNCPLSLSPCMENASLDASPAPGPIDPQCLDKLDAYYNSQTSSDFPSCACPVMKVFIACTQDQCKPLADVLRLQSDDVCGSAANGIPTATVLGPATTRAATATRSRNSTGPVTTGAVTATKALTSSLDSSGPANTGSSKPSGAAGGRGGLVAWGSVLAAVLVSVVMF
ncbi:hypothetical protein HDU97_000934 [Phlyctochytrium planicorne]|nr:hypothetical protein HDU97_000934 [Phlyctochytrium planicorne]